MRRRSLAVLLVGLTALTTACTSLWPLPDAPNGRYPAESLATVTPECTVVAAVAGRFKAMLAGAQRDGIGLVPETSSFLPPGVPGPPRIESCYRTYEMQVWWRDYYCSIGRCGLAASPGTSKHGLALGDGRPRVAGGAVLGRVLRRGASPTRSRTRAGS